MNSIRRPLSNMLLWAALCGSSLPLGAQDSGATTSPKLPPPPQSYPFAMRLPPDTDCTAQIRTHVDASASKAQPAPSPATPAQSVAPSAIRFERAIRKEIAASTQFNSDGTSLTNYFVGGWCAFDSPKKGLNVRRRLPGSMLTNIAVYHFPELDWALPETRQVDPPPKAGARKMRFFKDGEMTLEADDATGFPMRFSDGRSDWTYTYQTSAVPIEIPENIQKAIERVSATGRHKP